MTQNIKIVSRVVPADLETPVGIYLKIRDLYPESALLESSDYHTSQNSVSYIGVHPIASFTVSNDTTIAEYPDGKSENSPVTHKRQVMQRLKEYVESFNITGQPLNLSLIHI